MVRKMAVQVAHKVQRFNAFVCGAFVCGALADRRGGVAVEYALIAGGVVLVIIVGIRNYTGSIGTMFEMIANTISGGP